MIYIDYIKKTIDIHVTDLSCCISCPRKLYYNVMDLKSCNVFPITSHIEKSDSLKLGTKIHTDIYNFFTKDIKDESISSLNLHKNMYDKELVYFEKSLNFSYDIQNYKFILHASIDAMSGDYSYIVDWKTTSIRRTFDPSYKYQIGLYSMLISDLNLYRGESIGHITWILKHKIKPLEMYDTKWIISQSDKDNIKQLMLSQFSFIAQYLINPMHTIPLPSYNNFICAYCNHKIKCAIKDSIININITE